VRAVSFPVSSLAGRRHAFLACARHLPPRLNSHSAVGLESRSSQRLFPGVPALLLRRPIARFKPMERWFSLLKPGLGFMNTFDAVVSKAPLDRVRDLRESPSLIITSDYSGQHKGAAYETYALLIAGAHGWDAWEKARLELRQSFGIGRRRISFKGLGDARKRAVLPCFLNVADQLPGLCVVVAVDRSIRSLFSKGRTIDLSSPELSPYAHYDCGIFERLLRVVHLVSFFVAGLSRPHQDVLWFTDQDAIAANEKRLVELTGIWGNVLGN